MKKYQVEIKINAVIYGNAIRHTAVYVTEFEIDQRFAGIPSFEEGFKNCAAIQALVENYADVADQFDFVLDSNKKSVVEDYASKILFAESSKVKITEIN